MKAPSIYLNGNKQAQVLNNYLQYCVSYQSVPVITNGIPDQRSSSEAVPSQLVSNRINVDSSQLHNSGDSIDNKGYSIFPNCQNATVSRVKLLKVAGINF